MFSREIVMTLLTIISLVMTPKNIRKENHFSFYPILEVAAVFIGIFLTMIPVIMILKAKGATIHLTKPWEYFWLTGSLSSFLDNAPTYLTFFSLAQGITLHLGISTNIVANIYEPLLKGVSTGAVFMGAMTYIGNAPNFMVRSISEASKIKMPSFFGYMKYSIGILVPVFILINIIFLL
jgi:Na+/H+ antiporter NhaD/arsenite permease-like protein